RTVRARPRRAASRGQQVVDIGSDLRWIRIPFALPVAVYLPIWTRKLAMVGSTPLANCIVRSAQAAIRPEMRCPCHETSRRGGTDHLPLLGKWSIKLGECCRPNRWRRGDRLALAGHALHSRPTHSTAARRAKARTRLPDVG